MVKVIEKSEEELKVDIKLKKLEEITNNFSKDVSAHVGYPLFIDIISEKEKHIATVLPHENIVSVKNHKSFEIMYDLTKKFEEYTKIDKDEEEWTLKKDYME